MTVPQWLTLDPLLMIWHITQTAPTSIRKLRLLATAYGRYLESQPDYAYSTPASALGEEVADGHRTLESAWGSLNAPTEWTPSGDWFVANLVLAQDERFEVRMRTLMNMSLQPRGPGHPSVPEIDMTQREAVIRGCVLCVLGNPFRPVTVDPTWLTTTVVALAKGMYDEKSFYRMPILGDALQDAGCGEPTVLSHCRSEEPHVRGCWLIDALLGKA